MQIFKGNKVHCLIITFCEDTHFCIEITNSGFLL
jgi:hypothetical protein